MKRLTMLAAVCSVGLIAPTTVGAAIKSYNGTFEPGGTLSFDLKKTKNGKKILDYAFSDFPVQCTTGAETTTGHLTFTIKVKNNKFEANAQSNEPGAESKLTLTGNLKGRGQAQGTMRVRGENVLINDPLGAREDCTSPKTDWTASVAH